MKSLRKLHLYLGCLFAPVLVFFAVTGAWQLFNYHHNSKDGSYVAPKLAAALSMIHKDQILPGMSRSQGAALRFFMLAAAVGLIATTVLGVVMAFKYNGRSPVPVILCLVAGVVVPVALLWLVR